MITLFIVNLEVDTNIFFGMNKSSHFLPFGECAATNQAFPAPVFVSWLSGEAGAEDGRPRDVPERGGLMEKINNYDKIKTQMSNDKFLR